MAKKGADIEGAVTTKKKYGCIERSMYFEDMLVDILIVELKIGKEMIKGKLRYDFPYHVQIPFNQGCETSLIVPITFALDCDDYVHDWSNEDGTPILYSDNVIEFLQALWNEKYKNITNKNLGGI